MGPMKKLEAVIKKPFSIYLKKKRISLLEELFCKGLPVDLRPGLEYLVTRNKDEMASLVASEAEARREAIASDGEKKIQIWYSPKPGSAGDEVVENTRPSPGKKLEFTMKRVAHTGKNEVWGTLLYLLVREFKCERGIELGSCAGISAMYLSSAPSFKQLITVEGSTELSKIAEISLKNRPQVMVVNSLFDAAIDKEIALSTERFDFLFIDGHHEKVATIHYFNRLVPFLKKGALVIFDDVSWSYDMREAWEILSERTEFSHAIDLGYIGVCIMKSNGNQLSLPKKWDLRPISGKRSIGDPPGWKE